MSYQNGRLPDSALAAIPAGRLRTDAAAAWNALAADAARRGVPLRPSGPRASYRTYAEQVYFWNLYKSGQGNLAAYPGTSNHGWGLAVDVATPTMRAMLDHVGAAYGWSKAWSDAPCVPLDTRVLTRRGLITHDELEPGDETVGFNLATGRTEWTAVLGVQRHANAEVRRHEHSTVTLDATPGHRWLTTGRSTVAPPWLATMEEIDPQGRILLAGEGAAGPGLPITEEEAALIGWGLTDGSIYRFDNSRGRRAFARVYQSNPVGVAAVDELMEAFDHRRDPDYNGKCVMWYVGRRTFSPILHRSRLDELGVVRFVLELDADQRYAFLEAVRLAEGDKTGEMRQIAQSEPDRREAFAIAGALEGHAVTFRARTVNLLKRQAVRRNHLAVTDLPRQDVWCPTTGLGTWTAEQNGHVFLTGNSEWWHIRWREGVWNRPPAIPPCKEGDRGHRVASFKRIFKRIGYPVGSPTDDYFGARMRVAVEQFQKSHGLTIDGVIGPETRLALLKAYRRWKKRHPGG